MSRLPHHVGVIFVAIVTGLFAAPPFPSQTLDELTATARARIEQARASVVMVKTENESGQTVAQAEGFFVRSDLVVTDRTAFGEASHVRVVPPTKSGTLEVLSTGNYFLPYVLLQKQTELAPLRLGDSDAVAVNDNVYMLNDQNAISAGRVTGMTTVKDARAFVISLAINSSNKGAPIFNRDGDVIGIAAQTQAGAGAGLALPSSLLAGLKQLGEPGVGVGRGTGAGVGPGTGRGVGPGDDRVLPAPSSPADRAGSTASTVDEKPVRVSTPPPRYTEAARANKIQGTVTLRVLVDANGDVKDVKVIIGLPDGLTERAMEAARESKFKPAMKDGKPVAYWVTLRMDFRIY